MTHQGAKTIKGLTLPLYRGPYQYNGASPWYAQIGIGTPAQQLKLAIDTGSNFNWISSSLSSVMNRQHYGGLCFDTQASSSFKILSKEAITVDFGPWGCMQVCLGQEQLTLAMTTEQDLLVNELYFSEKYQGRQFAELDWDGGIGVPSYSYQPVTETGVLQAYRGVHRCEVAGETGSFHFMESLYHQGIIDQHSLFVSFHTNALTKRGKVSFGQLDERYRDSLEYLFLPWRQVPGEPLQSLYYIWTTPMQSLAIGDQLIAQAHADQPLSFCLDSGSSLFKGDPDMMLRAYYQASLTHGDLIIELGPDAHGQSQSLTLPASLYDVEIEAGVLMGETLAQFQPMAGLEGLTLVGSVLLDHLYCVYQYQLDDNNRLAPLGMWLFNKPDDVKIIAKQQEKPAAIFSC
ncbi:pepsin-like aspartic protease [Celerinatantimonas diazotrophica]|uniref:Aspartyl protease n=1 Tax=Celerinatantimonas diazotrophica TaxID=412034 RepID=A0A4R1J7K8_9GAMM|nr:pepsin-like aspartic protease [Celerinatantimonas diazotrophica]TCK46413.1 aspartyl protease [Celerinatantimonas diazotrophica]CAG9295210.1 hypothetical protein CEDIAZO_00322 [Celerinatantimonas diazotrophica]